MNTIKLNTIGILSGGGNAGGGGGGVTINNQEKSVDITENGTIEVVADAGFTGLSKVSVNVNVPTGGGENVGGVDIFAPFVDDGKTRVWVSILQEEEKFISMNFTQSSKNGVEVDFGDGSPIVTDTDITPQNCYIEHTYEKVGQYCITLSPKADTTYELGNKMYQNTFFGSNLNSTLAKNVGLRVDIGNKCIGLPHAFNNASVRAVNFSPTAQLNAIGTNAFYQTFCPHFILPKTITAFESGCFGGSGSLPLRVIDCSAFTTVPSLASTYSLPQTGYNKCKIVVPDALYDEWIAATNWSSFTKYIVKASEFNG